MNHWGAYIPAPIIPVPPPTKPAPPPAGKEPEPRGWQTEADKARYCGFVDSRGQVDVEAFRRAIEAPWRQL